MRGNEQRLKVLETKAGIGRDNYPWHQVVVQVGQSNADAVRAYGLDRIGENDNVMFLVMVEPKWDADGNMIRQDKGDCRIKKAGWREQCGL